MTTEMKVQLEWCLSEIMEKYPHLTTAQAKQVLEMFHSGRYALLDDGWQVIDDFINDVLRESK